MSLDETMPIVKSKQSVKRRRMADSDTDYDVSSSRDLFQNIDDEDDEERNVDLESIESSPILTIHEPITSTGRVFPFNKVPDDPQSCSNIINEMYEKFFANERFDIYLEASFEILCKKAHYERDRCCLIEHIMSASYSCNAECNTLWLAISILDRYLLQMYDNSISKSKSLRISAAVLSIAYKYSEGKPMSKKLRPIDGALIESDIMSKLAFDIDISTAYHFLHYLFDLINASSFMRSMACYYLESTMYFISMLKLRPSLLAASVIYAVLHLCNEYPNGDFPHTLGSAIQLNSSFAHTGIDGMSEGVKYHTPKIPSVHCGDSCISSAVDGEKKIWWLSDNLFKAGFQRTFTVADYDSNSASYIDNSCSNSNMSNFDVNRSSGNGNSNDDVESTQVVHHESTPTESSKSRQHLCSTRLWGLHLMMDDSSNESKISEKINQSTMVTRFHVDDVITTAQEIIKSISRCILFTNSTSSPFSSILSKSHYKHDRVRITSTTTSICTTNYKALKTKFSSEKYHQVFYVPLPDI